MEIEIVPATLEQKPILRQLLELYQHDFSEYDGVDVNEHGMYGYPYLDYYWTQEGRDPFLIRVSADGGKWAGLVLVNSYCYVRKESNARSIAEFFVMRKYRRRGVGRRAAVQIFDRFPGPWEVIQHGNNRPSYRFWETVIDAYTGGRYVKGPVDTGDWEGQAITFDNSL